MATRRNALGRGLGALIPPTETAAPDRGEPDAAQIDIEVERIDPNPDQPRRKFDPADLKHLAESIERYGVLQPVVARRAGERYELVVGERRWRAAQAAGRERIPAVIADVAPQDRLEIALVENVQRRDLNPIELALAFRALAAAGATQEQIGHRVGLDRTSIANHLRLLDLPREFQEDIEQARITVGHAKALLQISNPERRRHLRDRIVGQELSVRDAEARARQGSEPVRRRKSTAGDGDLHLQAVIDQLRERLKTQVRVTGTSSRGRIEIEFVGSEDLNRILGLILDAPRGEVPDGR